MTLRSIYPVMHEPVQSNRERHRTIYLKYFQTTNNYSKKQNNDTDQKVGSE